MFNKARQEEHKKVQDIKNMRNEEPLKGRIEKN